MKKYEFNKNGVFATKDVAYEVSKLFPEKSWDSLYASVSGKFTKLGLTSINGQKQNRRFSGKDCQRVYDIYWDLANAKKEENQITMDLSIKNREKSSEFNVRVKGETASSLLEIKDRLAPDSSNADFVYDCIQLADLMKLVMFILHSFGTGLDNG